MECSSSDIAYILSIARRVIQIIQIIGPILLLIMLAIHLTKLLAKPEDKKLFKKVVNSGIAAVMLFFVPVFVNALMGMLGEDTTISSCWNSIQDPGIATEYLEPYENGDKKNNFITDPGDYEKGKPKPSPSSGSYTIGGSHTPADNGPFDDSKYSQYKTIATCDSSTMKYRIIQANNAELAIIWVKDPYMQMNGALAAPNSMARASAEQILSNEVSANGLQNKCLVAINASFFSYSTNSPVGGVVINKGNIVKSSGNASGCIGVDRSNKLVECSHKPANDIASTGIRNTFVISSPAGHDNGGVTANRTQICQIDSNNFVLYSGNGTVGGCANVTQSITGCSYSFNLDGGGSRKLYYKTQNGPITKVFGGGRTIPDMLYFAEQ